MVVIVAYYRGKYASGWLSSMSLECSLRARNRADGVDSTLSRGHGHMTYARWRIEAVISVVPFGGDGALGVQGPKAIVLNMEGHKVASKGLCNGIARLRAPAFDATLRVDGATARPTYSQGNK